MANPFRNRGRLLTSLLLVPVLCAGLARAQPVDGALTSIDLLARANMRRHGYYAQFRKEDGVIRSPEMQAIARLCLPATVPETYELVLMATRRQRDGSLHIGLICGGRQCMAVLDGNDGVVDGLNLVDGKAFSSNATSRHHGDGFVLPRGVVKRVICQVTPGSVRVTVDDQVVVDWRGDRFRLSLAKNWSIPPGPQLFVGTNNAGFEFSMIELRGQGAAAGAPQRESPAALGSKPGGLLPIPEFLQLPVSQRQVAQTVVKIAQTIHIAEKAGRLPPAALSDDLESLAEPWRERMRQFVSMMGVGRFIGAEELGRQIGRDAREAGDDELWRALGPGLQRLVAESESSREQRMERFFTALATAVRDGNSAGAAQLILAERTAHQRRDPVIDVVDDYLKQHWAYRTDGRVSIALSVLMVQAKQWREAALTNSQEAYLEFLADNPHSAYQNPTTKRLIALMRTEEHGGLPAVETREVVRGRGYAVLNIHNDTTHRLTVCYDGPETFAVVFKPGEKGSVSLTNGHYDIAGRVDAGNVRPYAGKGVYQNENGEARYFVKTESVMGVPYAPQIEIPVFTTEPTKKPPFIPWSSKRQPPDLSAPGTSRDEFWFVLPPSEMSLDLGAAYVALTPDNVRFMPDAETRTLEPVTADTLRLKVGEAVLNIQSEWGAGNARLGIPPGHRWVRIGVIVENAGALPVRLHPRQFSLKTTDVNGATRTHSPLGMVRDLGKGNAMERLQESRHSGTPAPMFELAADDRRECGLVFEIPEVLEPAVNIGRVLFQPTAAFAMREQ